MTIDLGWYRAQSASCLHIDQSEARAVLAVTNHEVLSTCPRSWRPLAWLPRTLLRSPGTEHSVGYHLHISFLWIIRKGVHITVPHKKTKTNVTRWKLELSMSLREASQWPEQASNRAYFLLRVPSSTFTIKNLLRHNWQAIGGHRLWVLIFADKRPITLVTVLALYSWVTPCRKWQMFCIF